MTLRGLRPELERATTGLMGLMDRHGGLILLAEVGILATTAVLAMMTDDFWSRRGKDDVN
jgi:hypothetical protein